MENAKSKVFLETAKLKDLNSGLGQFCFHLSKAFIALKQDTIEFDFYLRAQQNGILGKVNSVTQKGFHKFFPIQCSDYKLWHCFHQDSPYLPAKRNIPMVLTIHDLNILKRYTGIRVKRKLGNIQKKIDRAEVITAISEFTAGEVREHMRLGNKPVHVIHNGNALTKFLHASKPSFMPDVNFLYSIGIIQPKKNFHVLIPLMKRLKSIHLVIAGNDSDPYVMEIKELAKSHHVEERLVIPGKITEAEKYWLYKNCEAFLFPSLTEGFGLPVVEAMSMGKPVFLYRGSSLPEVGGEEAFYWDSVDPDHMSELFLKGMEMYNQDPGKKQRIVQWADQFSWTAAAQKYFSLYKQYLR